jgi:hypothetical protein
VLEELYAAPIAAQLLAGVVYAFVTGLRIGLVRVRDRVLFVRGAITDALLRTVAIGGADATFFGSDRSFALLVLTGSSARLASVDV